MVGRWSSESWTVEFLTQTASAVDSSMPNIIHTGDLELRVKDIRDLYNIYERSQHHWTKCPITSDLQGWIIWRWKYMCRLRQLFPDFYCYSGHFGYLMSFGHQRKCLEYGSLLLKEGQMSWEMAWTSGETSQNQHSNSDVISQVKQAFLKGQKPCILGDYLWSIWRSSASLDISRSFRVPWYTVPICMSNTPPDQLITP